MRQAEREFVCLRYLAVPLQEPIRWSLTDLKLKRGQNLHFHVKHLLPSYVALTEVNQFFDLRRHNLFILGWDQNSSKSNELQLRVWYVTMWHEPIDKVYSDEKCFWEQFVVHVEQHYPVDEDCSCILVDHRLPFHVGRVWLCSVLWLFHVLLDLATVLTHVVNVVDSLSVFATQRTGDIPLNSLLKHRSLRAKT